MVTERHPDGRGLKFHRISYNNAAYIPLHYVLLFPTGQRGWTWGLQLDNEHRQRKENPCFGQQAYYRFHFHTHVGEFSTVHHGGRLFQQYVVDSYAMCDMNRLEYMKSHQNLFCTDLYNGLTETLI